MSRNTSKRPTGLREPKWLQDHRPEIRAVIFLLIVIGGIILAVKAH
ncbi:MAG: hypothetical protein ACRDRJ_05090 [Streptosporangiaceae bacterium]